MAADLHYTQRLMTAAAGVQNLDSASYAPPPTSSSTSDAKGSGAAGRAKDPQGTADAGQPSDFQSELAQQTSTHDAPAGQTGSNQTGATQNGSRKTASGKPEKKKDARADDANPSVVMLPVQVAEPQNQILPFSVALAQPQENAELNQSAQPSDNATADDAGQGAVQQAGEELSPSVPMAVPLPEVQQPADPTQPAASKSSGKRQSVKSTDPLPGSASDSSKVQVSPLASSLSLNPQVKVGGPKSDDSSSQDPTATSAKPGSSQGNQPEALAGFKLPASPAEPAASGVQESANSAPASPAAMAFAARISSFQQTAQQTSQQTAQQKTDQTVAVASAPSSVISGSTTPDQIPMRHAATAQIIQSAALVAKQGTEEEEPKKDAGSVIDKFARPDTRTDFILPRFEASGEPAPSSASQAPQQAAPAARPESIIEPPAAPPTSPHDIRVRVPDNNGGSTQVRFVESGGEVRVSVRTADDGLAQNLRTHLNDLTQRLSDGGMPAEIWKPLSSSSSSQNDQQPSHQDGRGSGGQGSGGQGGQQERQQQRPAWLEEMEASLHGERN